MAIFIVCFAILSASSDPRRSASQGSSPEVQLRIGLEIPDEVQSVEYQIHQGLFRPAPYPIARVPSQIAASEGLAVRRSRLTFDAPEQLPQARPLELVADVPAPACSGSRAPNAALEVICATSCHTSDKPLAEWRAHIRNVGE